MPTSSGPLTRIAEEDELVEAKKFLLNAIRDRDKNTNPAQDAYHFATAYANLVSAEMALKRCRKHQEGQGDDA